MSRTRFAWLVPTGLILLSLIPMVAGAARLVGLSGPATAESARFHETPWPVVVHIVGATLFSGLGAFQFHRGLRQTRPRWHRLLGRVLLPAGLAAALSGLWMAYFYPLRPSLQGDLLLAARTVVGALMAGFLVLAWRRILERDVQAHRAWVTRAYALGVGAGTQAVLGLPVIVLMGQPPQLVWELLMTLAWVINAALAERAIASTGRRPRPSNPRLPEVSVEADALRGS